MKTKLGIKSRIFITFFLFIIFVINIFAYLLYILVSQKFIDTTVSNIQSEYQTITNFIDLQKESIFVIPEYELKNINSLGFFFYLGNNDSELQQKYRLGLHIDSENKNIIYRGDYRGYNIIIGKNIEDLNKIKEKSIEMLLLLNVFLVLIIFVITYILSLELLRPLSDISEFIKKYDVYAPQKLLKNEYGDSEIGKYIDSTNEFLQKIQSIFHSQKDFIQDVSHELKTPLMQIESSIEMIETKTQDEHILSKLENIKSGTQSINTIVSNLSFILRGEEQILQKQMLDIGLYFQEKLPEYQTLAQTKNIKVILEKKFALKIESNSYYIERLFDNLISNAIFYNDGNNILTITVGEKSVQIQDQGIGISSDELKKIFQRFYRNDTSVLYSRYGSGLGLSIVKKITDMFGWEIKVISKVGKGSIFEIVFVK